MHCNDAHRRPRGDLHAVRGAGRPDLAVDRHVAARPGRARRARRPPRRRGRRSPATTGWRRARSALPGGDHEAAADDHGHAPGDPRGTPSGRDRRSRTGRRRRAPGPPPRRSRAPRSRPRGSRRRRTRWRGRSGRPRPSRPGSTASPARASSRQIAPIIPAARCRGESASMPRPARPTISSTRTRFGSVSAWSRRWYQARESVSTGAPGRSRSCRRPGSSGRRARR